jgi:[acyl-carrier-protein] S-malonyltransferase
VFQEVDDALGAPLSQLCFAGPASELTLTRNAQPALLAHSMALWSLLHETFGPRTRAGAGHSLGEFIAHCVAGTFDLAAAARLVRRRGELMYEVGVQRPGTMAAIVGALTEPIEAICAKASDASATVVAANFNSPEQVVISGDHAAVDRAIGLAKAAGAKHGVKLHVSGAFHSPLMAPASAGLRDAIREASPRDPRFPVYSNVNCGPTTTGAQAADLLLRQLTSPVNWVGEVRALVAAYPNALFVELGPGNVLTGLLKRIAPGVSTAACGTATEVEHLLQLAAA